MRLSRLRLSRLLPKTKNPSYATTWAIVTCLFLVFLGLVLGFIVGSTKDKLTEALVGIVFSGIFVIVSWDVISALVGNAINAAADERFQNHLKDHPSDGSILEKQKLEFYSLLPLNQRRFNSSLNRIHDDPLLESIQSRAFARELILRVLGADDELLSSIALRACCKQLRINIENVSQEELQRNSVLTIFRRDIYIYLKAWLMQSIKYDNEMPVEDIKQRHPKESHPDKSAYIGVLSDIRDHWMKRTSVQELLDSDYQTEANRILDEYMDKLIKRIRHYDQTMRPVGVEKRESPTL